MLLDAPETAPEPVAVRPWTLGRIFRAYWPRIVGTYALFNLENLLGLAQPLALGLAIDGLLSGSFAGLAVFISQHLARLAVSAGRRAYDTRAFTRIYTDIATDVVLDQRGRGAEVSRVAARSALSREFVDFFEREVPGAVHALYSVAGALAMLVWCHGLLVAPFCVAVLVPVGLINRRYGRKTEELNGRLNDQVEREVEVIGRGRPAEVREHYGLLARWRVKLSDLEALNFGVSELLVLGLFVAALVRGCGAPGATAGDIFAILGYVLMFVVGLDSVPSLVQQLGRLRDIGRRMPGVGE